VSLLPRGKESLICSMWLRWNVGDVWKSWILILTRKVSNDTIKIKTDNIECL